MFRIASTSSFSTPLRLSSRKWAPALSNHLRIHPTTLRNYATEVPPLEGTRVTETNKAQATLKRFWKNVGVHSEPDGLLVVLDGRPLKTPGGNKLMVPHRKRLLASLIADEWDRQEKVLKNHALPLTSLASRAIDGPNSNPSEDIVELLLNYMGTDAICFHADYPESLVKLQDAHWNPLISWIQNTYDVKINVFTSVLGGSQPEETVQKLREAISQLDEWELAALERITHSTKSLLIAMAVVQKHLDVNSAAQAAHVEVNSQIEKWGEVEDTHDVDYHEIRRQLGSAVTCLIDLK